MGMNIEAPNSFEIVESSVTSVPKGELWVLSIEKKRAVGVGRNLSYPSLKLNEASSCNLTLPDVIDDTISRRRIWNMIFGDEDMPQSHEGSVEKVWGVLDGYFQSAALTGEQLLKHLKKSKG